jgi:hypothetical protein
MKITINIDCTPIEGRQLADCRTCRRPIYGQPPRQAWRGAAWHCSGLMPRRMTGVPCSRRRSLSYQRPVGLTGMRAGLAWRLRAKSMRYQRPVGQPTDQDFGPLVSDASRPGGLRDQAADPVAVEA